MRYRALSFDFDGTLVASADAKRQAFFDIFPDGEEHRAAIAAILRDDPDGSRHRVIPRMLETMRAKALPLRPGDTVEQRLEAYATTALDAVRNCPELPGAGDLLRSLSQAGVGIFVCSNTPHETLLGLLRDRGWDSHVDDCFGYPHDKAQSIATILARLGLKASELAVVGDGVSDAEAAAANGCPFFQIAVASDLMRHAKTWEIVGV
tara:strand:+ start:614 stop:1234 length:621 start_codon:yes stop_codon:yes gene_type:complete